MTAYRWCAPPRWPQPPDGFCPATSWQPHPSWPAPPANWRWWRLRRGLALGLTLGALGSLLVGLLLLGLAALGASDQATHTAYIARHDRGVTAQVRILSSHYDADGGDPGGWTTQTVLIPTTTGPVTADVGHHNEDPAGSAPTSVEVIYDPQHPSNAQTVQDYQEFGDYSAPVGGISARASAILNTTGVGILFGSLSIVLWLIYAWFSRPRSATG